MPFTAKYDSPGKKGKGEGNGEGREGRESSASMMCATCDEDHGNADSEDDHCFLQLGEPKCCCLPARELLIVWFCLSITDMARLAWHGLVKPTDLMGSEHDELDFLSEFDQDYHFTKPSVTKVVSAKFPCRSGRSIVNFINFRRFEQNRASSGRVSAK